MSIRRVELNLEVRHMEALLINANARSHQHIFTATHFHAKLQAMRTTLDLPDPLFREVKTRAVQQGVTLKELLAQYIQAGMNAPASAAPLAPRAYIPLPYFRETDGPVIPARSNAELFAILEEEDIAEHHRVIAQSQPKP